MIIAVEGADRSGKATQVRNILSYLRSQGISAETFDYPHYQGPFGGMAGDYLHGKFGPVRDVLPELHMLIYANDRKYYHDHQIKEWLDSGKWVVFDRYTYSNAFAVAKCRQEVWEEKIQFLETLEFKWWELPRAAQNFYLHIPPELSFSLRNAGNKDVVRKEEEKKSEQADLHEIDFTLQRDVTRVYEYLTKRRPAEWSFIDQMVDGARLSADDVFNLRIKPVIDQLIKNK